MDRLTVTTLGELKFEDRFYFQKDRQRVVYILKAWSGKNSQIALFEKSENPLEYREMKPTKTTVIFLRHGVQ